MSGGMAGTGYQGNDISTGSQTPEGITSQTDVFDSGMAGGLNNGGEGEDNGAAGS